MPAPSLLVVDDEPIVCQTLLSIFNRRGYKATAVNSAEEALHKLKSSSFDVLLIDVNLPDMNGVALMKEVKLQYQDRIYFFITGDPSIDSAIDAIDIGAEGYFLKPLVPTSIVNKVEKALRQLDLERRVKDSEAKLRALVEFSDGHIFMLNRKGKYQTSNNRLMPNSGRKREKSILGRSIKDVYPGDVAGIYHQKLDEVFEGGKSVEFEYSLQSADGMRHFVDLLYPILQDGRVSLVGGISKDITDRKNMETALIRSNVSLAEAHRIARLGTREWDIASNKVIWSSEAYRIFGFPPNGPDQFHDEALNLVHEDDRKKFIHYETRLLGGDDPGKVEYRVVRKDGDIRIIEEQGMVFVDGQGNAVRTLGTFRDVTEERRLRQESEYRLQQIIQADKLASLGEVVAGVAHEINNPNSFITYNVPLLEDTWRMFEPIIEQFDHANPGWRCGHMAIKGLCRDMNEIIQAIKIGSDRINKVVSNLKDFARVDDGPVGKPVQINQVIEKTMTIVGARVRKAVRHLNIDLMPDLPIITGHFQKLEQVIANLVLNAANAVVSPDSGEISISTRFIDRLEAVIIEVADNGLGMSPDVLERVFDPFFTTRRESGGTGLGLSVSYSLIKEHNGVIGVLSRQGIGSRFTVYLPLDSTIKLDLRPTILCVDDEPAILRLLHTFFVAVKKMPLNTLQNPEEVLEYLNNHPEVDIIISDIRMPQISGWDLYRKIRRQFPLVRVVLYSGDPMSIANKPADVPAPDHLFQKPFEFNKLLGVIEKMGRQRL